MHGMALERHSSPQFSPQLRVAVASNSVDLDISLPLDLQLKIGMAKDFYESDYILTVTTSYLRDLVCKQCKAVVGMLCDTAPEGHMLKKHQVILQQRGISLVSTRTREKAVISIEGKLSLMQPGTKRLPRAVSTPQKSTPHPVSRVQTPARKSTSLTTPSFARTQVPALPNFDVPPSFMLPPPPINGLNSESFDMFKFSTETAIASQRKDIDRISGVVERIEKGMKSFRDFMDEMRTELAIAKEETLAEEDIADMRKDVNDLKGAAPNKSPNASVAEQFKQDFLALQGDVKCLQSSAQKEARHDLIQENISELQADVRDIKIAALSQSRDDLKRNDLMLLQDDVQCLKDAMQKRYQDDSIGQHLARLQKDIQDFKSQDSLKRQHVIPLEDDIKNLKEAMQKLDQDDQVRQHLAKLQNDIKDLKCDKQDRSPDHASKQDLEILQENVKELEKDVNLMSNAPQIFVHQFEVLSNNFQRFEIRLGTIDELKSELATLQKRLDSTILAIASAEHRAVKNQNTNSSVEFLQPKPTAYTGKGVTPPGSQMRDHEDAGELQDFQGFLNNETFGHAVDEDLVEVDDTMTDPPDTGGLQPDIRERILESPSAPSSVAEDTLLEQQLNGQHTERHSEYVLPATYVYLIQVASYLETFANTSTRTELMSPEPDTEIHDLKPIFPSPPVSTLNWIYTGRRNAAALLSAFKLFSLPVPDVPKGEKINMLQDHINNFGLQLSEEALTIGQTISGAVTRRQEARRSGGSSREKSIADVPPKRKRREVMVCILVIMDVSSLC